MADIKWIKLATGLRTDTKMRHLRRLPNGDSIALMWVYLLCMAGEINDGGNIYIVPGMPYTEIDLADELGMDVETVRGGLGMMEILGMIERTESVLRIVNWDKHQSVEKMDRLRAQSRSRVQRHREQRRSDDNDAPESTDADDAECNAQCNAGNALQRALQNTDCNADCNAQNALQHALHSAHCNAQCNAENAQCNATDIDIDREIDIEREPIGYEKKDEITYDEHIRDLPAREAPMPIDEHWRTSTAARRATAQVVADTVARENPAYRGCGTLYDVALHALELRVPPERIRESARGQPLTHWIAGYMSREPDAQGM